MLHNVESDCRRKNPENKKSSTITTIDTNVCMYTGCTHVEPGTIFFEIFRKNIEKIHENFEKFKKIHRNSIRKSRKFQENRESSQRFRENFDEISRISKENVEKILKKFVKIFSKKIGPALGQ